MSERFHRNGYRGSRWSSTESFHHEHDKKKRRLEDSTTLNSPTRNSSPRDELTITSNVGRMVSSILDEAQKCRHNSANQHHIEYQAILIPEESLGSFSFDEHRVLHHDDRSQSIYIGDDSRLQKWMNDGRVNLNYNMVNYVERDQTEHEHIDAMLFNLMHRERMLSANQEKKEDVGENAICEKKDRFLLSAKNGESKCEAMWITWRGVVTKLLMMMDGFKRAEDLCSPRQRWNSYTERNMERMIEQYTVCLNIQVVDGKFFLEEHTTKAERLEKIRKEKEKPLRVRELCYHGFSFENWFTRRVKDFRDRELHLPPLNPVNTNEQWVALSRCVLGSHQLIVAGETDAILPEPHSERSEKKSKLVEMKMVMVPRDHSPRGMQRDPIDEKLLRFYYQCFQVDVDTLVVGHRTAEGLLKDVSKIKVSDIPLKTANNYSPEDFLNGQKFVRNLLDWLKSKIDHLLLSPTLSSSRNPEISDVPRFHRRKVDPSPSPTPTPTPLSVTPNPAPDQPRSTDVKESAASNRLAEGSSDREKPDATTSPSVNEKETQEQVERTSTSERRVFRMNWRWPFTEIELRELSTEEVIEISADTCVDIPRVGFLPESFIEFIRVKNKSADEQAT